MKNSISIFISYSWNDTKFVDELDSKLQAYGYKVERDKRDAEYAQNIKEFMKRIRKTDYSIIVLSDDFLKSENCMREIFEFIKDENFKDRIIPVILDSAKDIWSFTKGIQYTIYWKEKENTFKEQLKKIDEESKGGYIEDLKHISSVKDSIGEIVKIFRDMKMFDVRNKDLAATVIHYIESKNSDIFKGKLKKYEKTMKEISIGESKEFIDKRLGIAYYQYINDSGIIENIYVLDEIILRAYFKKGQLISYFFTMTSHIKLELPNSIQKFVKNKKLGEFTFYEIEGKPLNADAYTQNGTGHAFYSEEYYFGASGSYYHFYFMLLDYGIFNNADVECKDTNKQNEEDVTIIDSILVRNRKKAYPNTCGICCAKYQKEVYEMISTYENFDFKNLYNY